MANLAEMQTLSGLTDREGKPLGEWVIGLPESIGGYTFRSYDPNLLLHVVSLGDMPALVEALKTPGITAGEVVRGPGL